MKSWMMGCVRVGLLVLAGSVGAENIRIEPLTWEKGRRNVAWHVPSNATFRTTFFVPHGHERARWAFEAERAGGNIAIRVNGRKVGEAQAPIIRFTLSNVKAGTNTLEFLCAREYEQMETLTPETNPFRETRLRAANTDGTFSNYKLGFFGNERVIELASPGDIRTAWAETSVRRKEITLKARVDATQAFEGTLRVRIVDAVGAEALRFGRPFAFRPGLQLVELSQAWANPKLWDVGQGNLYTAHLSLVGKDGRTIDELHPFRFGFREIWTEGRNVMLNGHPLHTRNECWWIPLKDETYGFFKYLGRNSYYLQPHPNCWWGVWGETAGVGHRTFDFCDEHGILTFHSAPQVSAAGELLDERLRASYVRNTDAWCDIFRNHPSIIAWSISMNAYNPKGSIHPDLLGRREKLAPADERSGFARKQRNIHTALALCKQVDPTRLVYGHADGNMGDFGCGNCYPNWTPLQEIEEYPLAWYRDGDMPWFAVEYGVYSGSFYKSQRLLLTEYAAIYFGDRAYDRETEEQLEKTLELGVRGKFHGENLLSEVAPITPLYWDVIRLSTEGTDKYWRAFGMLGWVHFFGSQFGQPKKYKWPETLPNDKPPAWANPLVEMHRRNMQDLLVFIGGDEVFTDKTHSFYEGEEVRKNVVCVWDGANATNVTATWSVWDAAAGRELARGVRTVKVEPGRVEQIPVRFTVPRKGARGSYAIRMTATNGAQRMTDEFAFEAFPRAEEPVRAKGRVYLFDPKGKSEWVRRLMPEVRAYEKGVKLAEGDVLVIGREALRVNDLLPYRMEEIAKGARVLVLEQSPVTWAAFGFRLVDMVPRIVFETPYSREVMDGLEEKDLRYWRGAPNLLPEYRHVRDVQHPPKGVNRHGVASTVFELPQAQGFEPLFQCEFDLRYSPLLRFRSGKGCVYYSSFDFTGRVGVDPAATKLARNVLTRLTRASAPTGAAILVNDGKVKAETETFLRKGGIVLNVALDEAALKARGVKFEKRRLHRAKLEGELARAATRNMFRWRDYLDVNCITEKGAECGGVWYRRGNEVFLQVSGAQLEGRYAKNDPRAGGVTPTVLALDLLKSRVLTMLGAAPEARVCERLGSVCNALPYAPLRKWYAYGPFRYTDAKLVGSFREVLPGEEQAISGDMNPNFTYHVEDTWKGAKASALDAETRRRTFDFRRLVDADEDGYVDLSHEFQLEGKAAYCYLTHVWNEEKAGEAVFSFTFPSRAHVYLNGQRVFSAGFVGWRTGAKEMAYNALPVRLKLKAGENALTIKLATFPADMAAWTQRMAVTRALPGISLEDVLNTVSKGSLYNEKGNIDYAYSYYYW